MPINFNGSYSQNFDTLATTAGTGLAWSNDTTLPGWFLFSQPAPGTALTTYGADSGTNNAGSFYSYGASGSTERALGGLGSGGAYYGSPASGAIAGWIGFGATNSTGSTISSLDLSFNGEQWRNGGNATAQTMVLEYGFGSSFTTVPTWTAPGGNFNWTSPVATATAAAVDGNTTGLVSGRGGTLSNLNWGNGQTLWLRWVERNDAGNDHGLAIDNLSLTATTTGGGDTTPPAIATLTPADNATGIAITSNLQILFNENVQKGTGNIVIKRLSDNSVVESIAVSSAQVTVSGATVTIDPTNDLSGGTGYYVEIATGAIKDLAGNDFAGISGNTAWNFTTVGATTRIRDIQGAAHISPLNGQSVSGVPGIVTAIATNGFYFQDPNPDNDDRTSEGLFVFTSSAPTVAVGDSVLVGGTVTEFRPGGNANNLTITEITSPSISVLSSGNALPAATVLGNGGRTIPNLIIENDAVNGNVENPGSLFDPDQDGIDFYESVEGMRVQINNPVTTSPTANFVASEEIWVLADNGANALSRTARGGSLITASDFNPERIQIDDLINSSLTLPTVNVGAQLSTIVGVVNYDFNNYEVLVPTVPTVVQASPLQKEVTNLVGTNDQLTVATFNVENLDPGDGAAKFAGLANAIVNNLQSPDILSVEEIQDNNGATNNGVVDASTTYQTLINAIAAAGGPTYQYRQIDPDDGKNGGEPGGNIRVGFLFNPSRVSFVDIPGGTSTSSTTISNVGGTPTLSASPGLIDPTNSAFNSSRKPLVGQFTFNGQPVFVVGNHFNSKGGDQPLFGPNQPPALSSEVQRNQQATIVRNFVQSILAVNPNANVIVQGDLNDFEFSNPLTTLEGGGLNTLVETLPANERYTYNFQGNAQVLDHILVSNNLLSNLNGFDVVHINSEFADQVSDHDPVLARFNLSAPINIINGTAGRDTLIGTAGRDRITGGFGSDTLTGNAGNDEFVYTSIRDAGDIITDFTVGSDTIVLTQLLDSLVAGGYNGTDAIADGYVSFVSSGSNTILQIDQDGLGTASTPRSYLTLNNVTVAAINNPSNFVF
jgi:predicted extracellular nuclease